MDCGKDINEIKIIMKGNTARSVDPKASFG